MLNIDNIAFSWESSQRVEDEFQNSQNGNVIIDLDLNHPPLLNMARDVIPTPEVWRQFQPQTSKDFGGVDDEVTIISPRRFAEVCTSFPLVILYFCTYMLIDQYLYCQAKSNSRRNVEVVDVVVTAPEVNIGHSGSLAYASI